MTTTIVLLPLLLLLISIPVLIALFVAQFFLARAKNPFLGLILPILSFLLGLMISLLSLNSTAPNPIGPILFQLFLFQIPTVIHLLILGIARHGRKKNETASPSEEITKMNIKDL